MGLRLELREGAGQPETPREVWVRDYLRLRRSRLAAASGAAPFRREPVRYEGALSSYPFPSTDLRPGRGVAGLAWTHAVKVELDPGSGAFHLFPGAWIEGPRGHVNPMHLSGIFERGEPALFGTASSDPQAEAAYGSPFLLWRPGAATELLGKVASLQGLTGIPQVTPDLELVAELQKAFMDEVARLRRRMADLDRTDLAGRRRLQDEMTALQQDLQRAMLRAQMGGQELAVTFEDIDAWLHRAARAHAELRRGDQLQLGTLYQAQGLFSDEVFVPVFGKPIDAWAQDERYWLVREIQNGRQQQVTDRTLSLSYSVLIDALGANYPLVVGRELVQRRLRRLRSELLGSLTGLQATADSFDDLAAIEQLSATQFTSLWGEERDELASAVEQARSRLADDVLLARARRDVAAVEPDDPTAALRLGSWGREQDDLAPYVSGEARARALDVVHAKLDAVLAPELERRAQELASLGEGLAAVRAGAGWYRELMASFGFARTRPGVQQAVHELLARRTADLAHAAADIGRRLADAASVADVDALVAELLCVPGDLDGETGTRLVSQANARRIEIDRALFLARFSERERSLMVRDGVLALPTGAIEPPSGEEIRLAFLREMEWLGGRMVDAHSAKISMPGFDLLGLSNDLTIEAVSVRRTKADGDRGYYCEYLIDLRYEVGEQIREFLDGSAQGRIAEGLARMASESGPYKVVDHFVLTTAGWRSPSVRERGLESIADFYETVLESTQSALEIFGF